MIYTILNILTVVTLEYVPFFRSSVSNGNLRCGNVTLYSYHFVSSVFQYAGTSQPKWRVYVWGAADHGALGVNLQLKKGRSPISYLQKPVRTHFAEQHKVKSSCRPDTFSRTLLDIVTLYMVR